MCDPSIAPHILGKDVRASKSYIILHRRTPDGMLIPCFNNIRLECNLSTMASVYFLIVLAPKANIFAITRAECPCANHHIPHARARSLEIGLLTKWIVSARLCGTLTNENYRTPCGKRFGTYVDFTTLLHATTLSVVIATM